MHHIYQSSNGAWPDCSFQNCKIGRGRPFQFDVKRNIVIWIRGIVLKIYFRNNPQAAEVLQWNLIFFSSSVSKIWDTCSDTFSLSIFTGEKCCLQNFSRNWAQVTALYRRLEGTYFSMPFISISLRTREDIWAQSIQKKRIK